MKGTAIFLIAVVFVGVNGARLRDEENYDDKLTRKLSLWERFDDGNDEEDLQPVEWAYKPVKLEVPPVESNCCKESGNTTEICKDGECIKVPKNCTCNEDRPADVIEELQEHKRVRRAKLKICLSGCVNGTCVGLGKCKCWSGYKQSTTDKHACVPACKKRCVNSDCTSADKCTCREDYEPTDNKYVCKPNCYSWCNPGQCLQPYECTCNPGYVLQSATCRPAICLTPCMEYEFCAGDNRCDCVEGYRRNSVSYPISKCEPVCHRSCPTGKCNTPNHCNCDWGYKWNSRVAKCEPVCQNPCINGFSCVAPNQCVCQNGSVKNKTVPGIYGPVVQMVCSPNSSSAIISSLFFVFTGIMLSFCLKPRY